jgi:hypothetical protein
MPGYEFDGADTMAPQVVAREPGDTATGARCAAEVPNHDADVPRGAGGVHEFRAVIRVAIAG